MKKMLLSFIIGLTISLTGLSAENMSEVFSKELAQTKAAGNDVTMISGMETYELVARLGSGAERLAIVDRITRSRALQRLLLTKEFKDFSKDKKVTVININKTESVIKMRARLRELAFTDVNEILGKNAPKEFKGKKHREYFAAQAMTVLLNKERGKKVLLWRAFNGEAPVSLLLDSKGNVLNKTLYKHGLSAKDYIEKYTEILDPEEEDDKEKDSKVKSEDAK
jgi:hypothetical protein